MRWPRWLRRFDRWLRGPVSNKKALIPMASGSLRERVLKFQFACNKNWGR